VFAIQPLDIKHHLQNDPALLVLLKPNNTQAWSQNTRQADDEWHCW